MSSIERTFFTLACASLLAAAAPQPAHALNILLTNDDGFEAASLHAVYQRLEASGHSVIISAPAYDATAQGSGLTIGRAIADLPTPSRGGAIPAGAPGIGTLPSDPDVHYVNGSPVMSLLYGLDIVAKKKWGRAPDLVISGVNYGLNVGRAWTGSGTVGAAIAAIFRTVPAIAVSADYPLSSYNAVQTLQADSREYDLADFVMRVVGAVERNRPSSTAPLLPRMIGLNVNLPAASAGKASTLPVKLTKAGTASNAMPVFVPNLLRDWPISPTLPASPGIAYVSVDSLAPDLPRPLDRDPDAEYNVVKLGTAAITVMQPSVDATPTSPEALGARLIEALRAAPATPVAPPPPPATPVAPAPATTPAPATSAK